MTRAHVSLASARGRLGGDGTAIAALLTVFVASRVVVLLLGFNFETGPSDGAIQNIDPELLKHHLASSLWNLHGQPPLWNLLEGIVLKIFPGSWPIVWHLIFAALGAVEAVALYLLLRGAGAGRRGATVSSALFMLVPAVLTFESLFFYDYPSLVVLTVTALALQRFVTRSTFARGLVFFTGPRHWCSPERSFRSGG